ncbi:hypothetical protein GCM10028802_23870 [Terrabacter terrigena]
MGERLLRRRPDITIVHSLGTHALAGLLLPKGRRNVVVPWGSEVAAARGRRFRSWVAQRAIARADLMLVTSGSMAETIEAQWDVRPGHLAVVSWGVSPDLLSEDLPPGSAAVEGVRRQLGISESELMVLAPRGTGAAYRSDELRDAFDAARELRGGLRLVVLGAGESTSKRSESEVLLPYVSKPELIELLRASDAVVSVPHSDQRSTTVLEAVACGSRLLLSDIPPYRELADLGVEATLIREPIRAGLMSAMVALERIPEAAARKNRNLMKEYENQNRQMAQVVDLCTAGA